MTPVSKNATEKTHYCIFYEFGHSSLSSVEPGKSYGKGRVSTIDLLSKVVWFVKIGK